VLYAVLLAGTFASTDGGTVPPANTLYGPITSNRTLTATSPGPIYEVLGDVVVTPGVTLTIEPGVELRFAANRDTLQGGGYPDLCEFRIQGALVANASANDSIRFLSSNGGAGEWAGIFLELGGTASLQHVAIRGGLNGIQCFGNATLSHLAVSASSAYGVILTGGSIAWSRINDAYSGLLMLGPATASNIEMTNVNNGIIANSGSISECVLTGRGAGTGTGAGLYLGSGSTTAHPDSLQPIPTTICQFSWGVSLEGGVLRNAIVRDNGIGVKLQSGGRISYSTIVRNGSTGIEAASCSNWQVARIENSLVTNNSGPGIAVCLQSGSYADYLDSWLNGGGNYSFATSNFTPGPNRLSDDPVYLNPAANDFRLDSSSLFYTYSSSGGQLGAYGPGEGLTNLRAKSWGALKVRYR
jgi:hypothetical protein